MKAARLPGVFVALLLGLSLASPSAALDDGSVAASSVAWTDWFAFPDTRVTPSGFLFGVDADLPEGSPFDSDASLWGSNDTRLGSTSAALASVTGGSAQAIVTPTSGPPLIGACQIYPSDNAWNTDISTFPVHPLSSVYMSTITQDFTRVQTSFGNPVGSAVDASQPTVTIQCTPGVKYCSRSDMYTDGAPTPMPIPPDAEIENLDRPSSDRHVWVVDTSACKLYELFHANRIDDRDGSVITTNDISQLVGISWHWQADSAAIYDLTTNTLRAFKRPADTASGLPIFPGLVKYEEVAAGAIHHAMIFAIRRTQLAFIPPATTYSSKATDPLNPAYPPMGLRLRMKASYDTSGFYGQARVIVEAMKRYGLFVADNGPYQIRPTGSTGILSQWSYWPDLNNQLASIPVSAFEVIDTGPIQY